MKLLESYTSQPIPAGERSSTWIDLFVIWTASSICLPAIILGSLLYSNYSWNEALAVNLWGNLLVAALIAVGGIFGVRSGQPAFVLGRNVFGQGLGQWLPTFCILLSMLGWFAVITEMSGQALNAILFQARGLSHPQLITALLGLINATTAVAGYQRIRGLSLWSTPLLALACLLIYLRLKGMIPLHTELPYISINTMPPGSGLNLIIGGSIAGAIVASDFSRYTPKHVHNLIGTASGVFIASFLLGLLGMLSHLVTGNGNPLLLFQDLVWFSFPFILLATWTTNDNLLYSSGMALSNLLPSISRWQNTLGCGLLATVLAVFGITQYLEAWLSLLAGLMSPLLGVFLVHMLPGKRDYRGNTNWRALLATAAGVLAGWAVPAEFVPSLVALVLAGLVYAGLMKTGEINDQKDRPEE